MEGDEQATATGAAALRRRAEERVGREPTAGPDSAKLLHELRVHQSELEIQNEELRRIQRELEESRDRYHDLYDRAPIGYVTLDPAGTIIEANLTATVMLGLERRRLIGRKLAFFIDDAKALDAHRREVFSASTKRSVDLRIHRPDGRSYPAHLDSTSIPDDDGTPVRCRTVLIDLSELRTAQEDARSQKSRAASILDAAPDAIVTLDDECVIQSANPAARRMFGLHETLLRGTDVSTLVPALAARCRSGTPPPGEAVAVRLDGARVPVEIGAAEWRDHGSFRLTAVLRDLSERKDAERRLRQSEARFREIAETIQDVFYVTEREGTVAYVSPAFEEVWGLSVEEVYRDGRRWIEAVHAEDRARVEDAVERLSAGGAALDETFRIRRPDGSLRWVHDRSFPVGGAGDAPARFIGVARDVTVERELERELRHAQKMEAIGALASGIAHDFGNLLQVIIASVQVAMSDDLLPEQTGRVLLKAESAAKRGALLTEQITSFGNKERPEARPVELDAVLADTLDLLRRPVGRNVEVVADTAAAHARVTADRVLLEHLLMNLAANARDAMSGRGTITFATRDVELDAAAAEPLGLRPGRYVRLEVRDTGEGMDERTRQRVFEPFFTTKERGKGTGLGLSSVFDSMRRLGGHVAVESEPGQGTAFFFHFPRHVERRAVEPAPTREVALEGRRALVVEDEPVARMTLRVHLEQLGLSVEECEGPHEALALLADRPEGVALLVTDVVMPKISGPQLAEQVRERFPDVAVLYLSAHARDELVDRGVIERTATTLQKPVVREELAAAVRSALGAVIGDPSRGAEDAPAAEPDAAERSCVLVVEPDDVPRAAIERHLVAEGYEVHATDRPDRGIAWAEARQAPVDVLVAASGLPAMSARALADRLRGARPQMAVIVLSDDDAPAPGGVSALRKPVPLFTLATEIERLLGH